MIFVLPVGVVISAPSCFAPEESGHKKVRSHLRAAPPQYMVLAVSLPRRVSLRTSATSPCPAAAGPGRSCERVQHLLPRLLGGEWEGKLCTLRKCGSGEGIAVL